MLRYKVTPVQELHDKKLAQAEVRLLIKREDLNHPLVSGNKWWKLKYNLKEALDNDYDTLLTYGGAYSNHIFATAAAANEIGLKSVGIIRGEEPRVLNPMLSFALKQGMQLYYVARDVYRKKSPNDEYLKRFGNFYWIPEGGSNALAVAGVREFAAKLPLEYDYLCCAVGTGGTLSGLIEGVSTDKKIIGFTVLKGGEFITEEIKKLSTISKERANWQMIHDYHAGGYARKDTDLIDFMNEFQMIHDIPLEHVYTAKMLNGIYDLIAKGFFKRGATILAIHTGGIHTGE
jgi:1-aminocyclopropane-1-carboxylate deaminase